MSETVRPRSFAFILLPATSVPRQDIFNSRLVLLRKGSWRFYSHQFPAPIGVFPLLVPHQFPAPVGEGIGVGSALCFHTCYWRDIRAVISFISQSPILVPFIVAVCLKGILLTPPLAPPLQGRGTGGVDSSEAWSMGIRPLLSRGIGCVVFYRGGMAPWDAFILSLPALSLAFAWGLSWTPRTRLSCASPSGCLCAGGNAPHIVRTRCNGLPGAGAARCGRIL